MEFNKSDIVVLGKIDQAGGQNKLKSVTINTIIEKSKLSATKVRASIKLLLDAKYIEEGFMAKNAKTYYVTELGIEFLKELGCPVNR